VRGGARQGYLIDKSTALAASITNLEDLQDPEKAAFFDNDGDGKADLIGCNEGWGCEAVIEHHLDAYGLRDTVTHVQDNYDDLMRTTVDRYENGEPVLFYTWTPNWPIDQLQPGEDVLWLEVPFSSLPPGQEDQEAFTLVPDVEGCASNPCNLGYPLNDIRVAANSAFLEANPSARRLLQLVQIPLADIAEQNSEMFQGATSQEDIEQQAANWIIDNRDQVDDWLADAADWQPMPTLQRVRERGVLRCGIQDDLRGFGYREGATYTGFNADFCRVVATAVFGNAQAVEFVPVNVRERFAYVDDGRIDVLFHNATWLASRDTGMDPPNSGIRLELGPTIFHDGQRFMVSAASGIEQLDDLEGRTICVLADSTAESTLNEQLGAQGIGFDIERLSEQQLYDVYERGGCDAVTAATSELVARRAAFLSPETHTVLDQPISREPLSPAYAEGDSAWADIIRWSIYATIYAEEQQVDMDNVATALNQGDPDIERLLGERGFIGERLGLENEFAYQIIEQVGNYRDIYNRHVGPETPLDLPRGPNKTWNSPEGPGGVLSAPPFR
jgi:general L-amino acid transport system substrate-binding protein